MILLFRSPAQVTKRAKQKLVIFFPCFLLPFSPPPILRRPFCWTEEGSFWCCHLASAAGRESDPTSPSSPPSVRLREQSQNLFFSSPPPPFRKEGGGCNGYKKTLGTERGGRSRGDTIRRVSTGLWIVPLFRLERLRTGAFAPKMMLTSVSSCYIKAPHQYVSIIRELNVLFFIFRSWEPLFCRGLCCRGSCIPVSQEDPRTVFVGIRARVSSSSIRKEKDCGGGAEMERRKKVKSG